MKKILFGSATTEYYSDEDINKLKNDADKMHPGMCFILEYCPHCKEDK